MKVTTVTLAARLTEEEKGLPHRRIMFFFPVGQPGVLRIEWSEQDEHDHPKDFTPPSVPGEIAIPKISVALRRAAKEAQV